MNQQLEYPEIERRQDILSLAINQCSEGIAVIDLEGNLLYVNGAFAEMHGYSPRDILGKHFSIFHTPEQMPSVDAANRELREKGVFKGEIWHKRGDGSVFPTMMHNTIVKDDNGKPIAMIGTMRDISEQRRIEEALIESEKWHRMFLENLADVVFEADNSGNITYANKASEELTGLALKDIVGKPFLPLFDERSKEIAVDAYQQTLNGKSPEYELTFTNGNVARFKNKPRRDNAGHITGVFGTARDVTAHKNVESRQKFQRDLAVGLNKTTTLEATLDVILNHMLELEEFDCGGIYFINEENGALEFIVSNGLPQGFVDEVSHFDSGNERIQMIMKGDPFFLPACDCLPSTREKLKRYEMASVAVVPIKFQERVMGSINLASHTHDTISDYSMSILRSVSKVEVGGPIARVIAEEALSKTNLMLEEKVKDRTAELNEKNITLKVLMEQRKEERVHLEEAIMSNVKRLVMPNINRLRNSKLSSKQQTALNILEGNLNEIVSPFSKTIDSNYMKLTPTEIQVANYIKHGSSSKDISESLALSQRTVDTHRYNIRKKLGIRGKGVNLRTYLSSI